MDLHKSLLFGLAGAVLMFLGDMILYYDKADYKGGDSLSAIITIMRKVSRKRLYLGGILGPLSAFLYCIGFYHMTLFVQEPYRLFGWMLFLINSLGIICGGAYHNHCAYLGLLSRYENNGFFDEYLDYLKFIAKITFVIVAIGVTGLALLIVLAYTVFPRWMVLFTPPCLILLTPLVKKLPKGLHMIINGGWGNLVYVIYYLAALICLSI